MSGRYATKTILVSLRVNEAPGSLLDRPELAAGVARAIFDDLDADQEHFIILAVDAKNYMIGYKVVSSGSMGHADVDPRILFRSALLMGAYSIILAHNHPSGDPTPSMDDTEITKRLSASGKMLSLPILDHIIVAGDEKWVSLRQRGVLQ